MSETKYRIIKEKGINQNITLENTETKANVIIGKLTIFIMSILEKEIEFGEIKDGAIKLTDKWDFEISYEAGKQLARLAMPIKKPIRAKVKKETPKPASEQNIVRHKTKSGKEVVDVFDLIFGTE